MPYCPNCGKKIDEKVKFCPHCGTEVKAEAAPSPTPPTTKPSREEKEEKHEKEEKYEKHEKHEVSYFGFLITGLALIIFGVLFFLFEVLRIPPGVRGAIFLIIIGIVILLVALIYSGLKAAKSNPKP